MDKVQNKPNSSVQHKPSSESFQVYLVTVLAVGYKEVFILGMLSCTATLLA
jgi:hypothetical protein